MVFAVVDWKKMPPAYVYCARLQMRINYIINIWLHFRYEENILFCPLITVCAISYLPIGCFFSPVRFLQLSIGLTFFLFLRKPNLSTRQIYGENVAIKYVWLPDIDASILIKNRKLHAAECIRKCICIVFVCLFARVIDRTAFNMCNNGIRNIYVYIAPVH